MQRRRCAASAYPLLPSLTTYCLLILDCGRASAFERRAAAGAQRERLNEFECAICLEAFKGTACPGGRDRVAVLPCGHAMFCAPCAAKFRRCPQGCDGFRGILKLFL